MNEKNINLESDSIEVRNYRHTIDNIKPPESLINSTKLKMRQEVEKQKKRLMFKVIAPAGTLVAAVCVAIVIFANPFVKSSNISDLKFENAENISAEGLIFANPEEMQVKTLTMNIEEERAEFEKEMNVDIKENVKTDSQEWVLSKQNITKEQGDFIYSLKNDENSVNIEVMITTELNKENRLMLDIPSQHINGVDYFAVEYPKRKTSVLLYKKDSVCFCFKCTGEGSTDIIKEFVENF